MGEKTVADGKVGQGVCWQQVHQRVHPHQVLLVVLFRDFDVRNQLRHLRTLLDIHTRVRQVQIIQTMQTINQRPQIPRQPTGEGPDQLLVEGEESREYSDVPRHKHPPFLRAVIAHVPKRVIDGVRHGDGLVVEGGAALVAGDSVGDKHD